VDAAGALENSSIPYALIGADPDEGW